MEQYKEYGGICKDFKGYEKGWIRFLYGNRGNSCVNAFHCGGIL